jgi:hypothetical protein
MLVSQAHSLNAIFTELARRSALNMGEYIEPSEKYMRLAFEGAVAMPRYHRDAGSTQEPASRDCQASQHLRGPPASEQRHLTSRGSFKQSAKRTIRAFS